MANGRTKEHADKGTSNVVEFSTRQVRGNRPPPLSDDELIQLRSLLTASPRMDVICNGCPMARRLLEG